MLKKTNKMLKNKGPYDIIKSMEKLLLSNKFFNLPEVASFFTLGHFLQIFIMIFALVGTFFAFRGKKQVETKFFAVLGITEVLLMLSMFLYSAKTGIYNPEWYFPAHICNLFMIIFPVMAIFKGKVREFFYDYTFFFGILGCLFGITFPATTQLYFAPFSFISALTWLYHVLIGVGGVYVFASGKYFPKISTLWRLVAVFVPLMALAVVFNNMWQTNFVFLNIDKYYYPLTLFQEILGEYFTYVVAAIFSIAPIMLLGVSLFVLRIKNKYLSEFFANNRIFEHLSKSNVFDNIKNLDYVTRLRNNKVLTNYFESLIKFISYEELKKCYYSVEDDIKNLTVGQFEDATYMYEIIKKSKVINAVLEKITMKKFKEMYTLVKQFPIKEIINVTNEFNASQKALQAGNLALGSI